LPYQKQSEYDPNTEAPDISLNVMNYCYGTTKKSQLKGGWFNDFKPDANDKTD